MFWLFCSSGQMVMRRHPRACFMRAMRWNIEHSALNRSKSYTYTVLGIEHLERLRISLALGVSYLVTAAAHGGLSLDLGEYSIGRKFRFRCSMGVCPAWVGDLGEKFGIGAAGRARRWVRCSRIVESWGRVAQLDRPRGPFLQKHGFLRVSGGRCSSRRMAAVAWPHGKRGFPRLSVALSSNR